MGFYLRKSIKVGLFRFNISKSGVGVSAGVKGLRLGSGPRGNYVRVANQTVYYQKTNQSGQDKSQSLSKKQFHSGQTSYSNDDLSGITHGEFKEIESESVFGMVDSNSAELLEELNNKHKKIRFWPLILFLGLASAYFTLFPIPVAAATGVLAIIAYNYDQLRKTTVLFYDLDDKSQTQHTALLHSMDEISKCKKVWHEEATAKVYDKKYHAGADNLVKRSRTFVNQTPPGFVKTNIAVPAIGVGKQILYFFPDRLLVFENNAVGAVSYKDLDISAFTGQFVETERVPSDAHIVDYTWRYVNKRGGPDRRFSDNSEIPVVEYGYIEFESASGLCERISISRTDKGEFLVKALRNLAKNFGR